ncbi:hypothetical protein H6F67_13645 [Microcoleus sp. FACHB-1515]|uniref:hypothetical protein n=1 Tax=Cyanophyceae TaxID=3028117 RepID=UPI001686F65A|nr:hypothetical protein [Microcoleus sp. FACHB-1515]MBD2090895.1 hypothetical protein [Microcoleus sp. FACHB-1515]
MNIFKTSATVFAACAFGASAVVAMPQAARADYQSFNLAPGFMPDPAVGTGLSGGSRATNDCGYVDAANAPDHVVTLTRPFQFLRASVEAEGDVTLLITGPDGRYCSDDANGLMPEVSGFWPAGTYQIWVGDFVGDRSGTYRYELYLSEE